MHSHPFALPLLLALAGAILSIVAEKICIVPKSAREGMRGPFLLRLGVWFWLYAPFLLVTNRPIFSLALALALFVTLILVNNAKYESLKEPFIFQDYDYFLDTIRCPRLFLPFFGVQAFLAASLIIGAALVLFLWEEPPKERFAPSGQLEAVILLLLVGTGLMRLSPRVRISLDPIRDLEELGYLNCLYLYARAQKGFPKTVSPLTSEEAYARARSATARLGGATRLPHLVAVQSESFFDPRPLWTGIDRSVLADLDALQRESELSGSLLVPARGANTIRTEFAFLTGIEERELGIHRFNPYRAIAHGWRVSALPGLLKDLGYTTICLHPYMGSFYFRDKIFPQMGFDHFLDIRSFAHAPKDGAYIADEALARRILEALEKATTPLFILAITMENHGPLQLEHMEENKARAFYTEELPKGLEELNVYLRHLKNADHMIGLLRENFDANPYPVSLCWYGDHVPIMPRAYATFGEPEGTVPYALWNNKALARERTTTNRTMRLSAHELAEHWLGCAGLCV